MDPKTVQNLNDFFIAAAIIGGVAVLIAIPAFILMRRSGQPLCPRWKPPGVPWRIAALLMCLFPLGLLSYQVNIGTFTSLVESEAFRTIAKINVGDPDARKQLTQIWAATLTMPIFLMVYVAVMWFIFGGTEYGRLPRGGVLARNTLLGVCGWAIMMPLTFAVHFAVLQIFHLLGLNEQLHPLMALRPQQDGTGGFLFAFAVCVCTPVVEECLFRGLLVPWAAQRRFAPWVLMGAAFFFAALTSSNQTASVSFVAFLCVVQILIQAFVFFQMASPKKLIPRRTIACIIASSTVFAAAHSAIWPTPIPLFVLACGLGYLTARSRSIVPAVVVHGLFNAVSFVMLCRGSTF